MSKDNIDYYKVLDDENLDTEISSGSNITTKSNITTVSTADLKTSLTDIVTLEDIKPVIKEADQVRKIRFNIKELRQALGIGIEGMSFLSPCNNEEVELKVTIVGRTFDQYNRPIDED